MAQVIVGLDIGSRAVRAARLRVGFKNLELEKLVAGRLDDDPWPAIAETCKGADVVFTSVPGDLITIRHLEFPKAAARRLDQILPIELDGEIPFDVSEMVIGHRVTRQTSDHVEVLVVATEHDGLESTLEMLSERGINPREVAPAPIALASLARQAFPEETVAMVDVGHRRTDIAIVKQGEFQRARTCSFGGQDVDRSLASAFGVPLEKAEEWKVGAKYLVTGDLDGLDDSQRSAVEAVRAAADRLVRDLRQTLAAYTLGGAEPVGRVVLSGAASRLPGLVEYLSNELGQPCEHLVAPETIGGADAQDVIGGAMALSLALSGTLPRGERINLRTGDLAFEGEAKVGRGLMIYAVVAVMIVMMAWAFSAFGRHRALAKQQEVQNQQLSILSKSLLGQEVQSFSALRQLMVTAVEKQAGPTPIPTRDAFDVVEEISRRIPQKINHEIDTLDIRSGRVQLKGRVDQRRDADEIQEALSGWEECFVKVPVPQTTPAVRDKRLQYSMDIETRCP